MLTFRPLKAEEIECRVQSVSKTGNGLTLLLYKDARCDMKILDETVGVENWQREHYEACGQLFCRVGININYDDKEKPPYWIWKSDCGTESNTEAEKGRSSDSFKRSCFCLGLGRELYSGPFIFITANNCNLKDGKCYDKFKVEKIITEDGEIKALSIWNTTLNKRAFVWQKEV